MEVQCVGDCLEPRVVEMEPEGDSDRTVCWSHHAKQSFLLWLEIKPGWLWVQVGMGWLQQVIGTNLGCTHTNIHTCIIKIKSFFKKWLSLLKKIKNS